MVSATVNILELKDLQKKPFRGVLRKRCSENMQQIYWRAPMPKCDFNNFNLNSHFIMAVLKIWIFSEHIFLRARLNGCFCYFVF